MRLPLGRRLQKQVKYPLSKMLEVLSVFFLILEVLLPCEEVWNICIMNTLGMWLKSKHETHLFHKPIA